MNGLHDGLGGMDHQPVVNGFADEEVILQNASRGHFELISLQYVIFKAFLSTNSLVVPFLVTLIVQYSLVFCELKWY